MNEIKDMIQQEVECVLPDVVKWRRHFHKYPEVSGDEKNTSAYIQEQLKELGIPFQNDVYGYAVVGSIEGAFPGPTVALRADMDALPVTETTGLEFASATPGVMHACGHDSHMAIALGAAAVLKKIAHTLHGTVKLIFQPAEEEALLAGAVNIVKAGVLDDVVSIYGLHVWPELPVGTVGLKKGHLMAASDRFKVHIHGKSTHGATPHLGTDAIVAAAQWIVAIQALISRETNPMEQAVCTVGVLNSGVRYNVGAEDVYLEGTCRTYDPAKRDWMERRLAETLQGLDTMYGTTSTLDYKRGHGATINHDEAIEYLTTVGQTYLGKEAIVHPAEPSMAAEDFSAYLQATSGAFVWLGTGTSNTPALHHSAFTIDESILSTGVTLMSAAMAEQLKG